jgi:thioredoxin-related protein
MKPEQFGFNLETIMKRIALYLLACGLGFAAGCSAPPAANVPESPQASGTTVTTQARWLTSLPEAQALAQKENKLILVDFTGSDWCVYCKKLDADIFAKSEFADYARKHLVLVQLDFPHQTEQPQSLKVANEALVRKYDVDGFPTLLAMKPGGAVVWKQVGYLEGGPVAMIAKLDEAGSK